MDAGLNMCVNFKSNSDTNPQILCKCSTKLKRELAFAQTRVRDLSHRDVFLTLHQFVRKGCPFFRSESSLHVPGMGTLVPLLIKFVFEFQTQLLILGHGPSSNQPCVSVHVCKPMLWLVQFIHIQ